MPAFLKVIIDNDSLVNGGSPHRTSIQPLHRLRPIHIEGDALTIHCQQFPIQLTAQQPVISDSGEWAQAIDTQIHLSKGTT